MKLIWEEEAQEDVKQIFDYLKSKSPQAAKSLLNHFLDAAEPLRQFPQMGSVEALLEDCADTYRYLVVDKHYKLIYIVELNAIHIVTVWDCRQMPGKLRSLFK